MKENEVFFHNKIYRVKGDEILVEGIIYQGFLLSKEDFIQKFLEEDNQYFQNFKTDITNLLLKIQRESLSTGDIYHKWDIIQKTYFQKTLLLEIFQSKESNDIQFSPITEEVDVISKGGYIRSKKMYDKIIEINRVKSAENFKNLIVQHYQQLLKIIENQSLTKKEAREAHIQQYFSIKSFDNKIKQYKPSLQNLVNERLSEMKDRARKSFTNKTFKQVIYQNMSGQQYQGKVWDAFMNHVGNYHKEIIMALASPEIIPKLMQVFFNNRNNYEYSVYEEEKPIPFVRLLYQSLNSTPWFASGDIVIIGEDGRVLYNIQLKTTTQKKGSFKIPKTSLINFLKELEALSEDRVAIAELLYENLKTKSSNNFYRADKELEQSLYRFVEQNILK